MHNGIRVLVLELDHNMKYELDHNMSTMAKPLNVRLMLRAPTLTANRSEVITPTSREELHQQNFSSNVRRPIPYANRTFFSGTLKKFNKILAMVLLRGKVLLVVEVFLLTT
ncbi:hypothetical protein NC651_039056 [Populus alba x Populus x berolinensis]|nr:hypothetical protein NC651_039056 [Populus alba x Populus x berolinensis]